MGQANSKNIETLSMQLITYSS